MKSGDIQQYKQLSQFSNLKDFNNQFEQWMVDLKVKFSKGELLALKRLVRFSTSITGVCYAKIQTIVAATHEHDGMGISRSTFERMLRKARNLGLIEVLNTFKGVRKGHNVYVFKPYECVTNDSQSSDEVLKEEKIDVSNKTINLFKSSNIKDKDLRTDKPVRIKLQNVTLKAKSNVVTLKVSDWVNKSFSEYAGNWFHDKQVEELWRITYIHNKQYSLSASDLVEVSIQAIQTIVKKMEGKRIKNPFGYYNGVIRKQMKTKQLEDMFLSMFEG